MNDDITTYMERQGCINIEWIDDTTVYFEYGGWEWQEQGIYRLKDINTTLNSIEEELAGDLYNG